jgi:hypothetical protein
MSFAWLIMMALWALIIGPFTPPRCETSASFGFLPAAMVVPFLMLPLYAVSVVCHAVLAFRRTRRELRERAGVPLFGLDAAFFVPFVILSLIAFSPTMHLSALHCLVMAVVVALPWIITPIVNARILGWVS